MLETLGKKRITINGIAMNAGVTKSTVSMAFRNKNGISQATSSRHERMPRRFMIGKH